MSYGNKVDANHAYLRDNVFRKLCREVIDCSQLGMGFADLLILTNDYELFMVEIKDGTKPPSKRRLTEMQKDVARRLGGYFLVVTNEFVARIICENPSLRHCHTGDCYMELTK